MKLVECVPNFSEGRRKEVIDAIVGEIKSVPGIKVLSVLADADHNRLDVSYLGEPEAVKKAVFNAAKKATELIDMNAHSGQHPRMGATDVIPFIPIREVTMEECVLYARETGERLASELQIPVYFYEAAATRQNRINLADVRRGEYEGIKKDLEAGVAERNPDLGPSKMHATAGATAVCARMPLIAFNVNLASSDLSIAKKIAKAVRGKDGGLKNVKALGFEIKERGIVQVSMNLVNYLETPVFRVFDLVKREAERYGVSVIGSEIVGMIPMQAIVDSADYYLRLEKFEPSQVIEANL